MNRRQRSFTLHENHNASALARYDPSIAELNARYTKVPVSGNQVNEFKDWTRDDIMSREKQIHRQRRADSSLEMTTARRRATVAVANAKAGDPSSLLPSTRGRSPAVRKRGSLKYTSTK
jgi:hypothetical protein